MKQKFFISPLVQKGHSPRWSYEQVGEALFFKILELCVMDAWRVDPWQYSDRLKETKIALSNWDYSAADFIVKDCAFRIEK